MHRPAGGRYLGPKAEREPIQPAPSASRDAVLSVTALWPEEKPWWR